MRPKFTFSVHPVHIFDNVQFSENWQECDLKTGPVRTRFEPFVNFFISS
jgi:hypothetical protein